MCHCPDPGRVAGQVICHLWLSQVIITVLSQAMYCFFWPGCSIIILTYTTCHCSQSDHMSQFNTRSCIFSDNLGHAPLFWPRSHHRSSTHDAAQWAGGQGNPHHGGRDRQLPEGTVLLAEGPKADGSQVQQAQNSCCQTGDRQNQGKEERDWGREETDRAKVGRGGTGVERRLTEPR